MQMLNHPVLGQTSQRKIEFYFEDQPLKAREGQTIAAALMANGIKKFGISRKLQQARGAFCFTGRCTSCFVTVDGLDHVLSCMFLVEEGMKVYANNGDPDVRSERVGN